MCRKRGCKPGGWPWVGRERAAGLGTLRSLGPILPTEAQAWVTVAGCGEQCPQSLILPADGQPQFSLWQSGLVAPVLTGSFGKVVLTE